MTQLASIHHSLHWCRDGKLEVGNILNTPLWPLLKVVERGKICQGACLCFMCFSAGGRKKYKVEDLWQNRFMCIDVGIARLSTAWPGYTSSYPLLCLMALHQNVQPGVDSANENVSQPCVPRQPRRASVGCKETRRRHWPMLCCAVSDWWHCVVALWLGFWWFITAAHNVISLCVYIHSVLQYDAHICVFFTGALVGYLHVITMWWLEFYWLAKSGLEQIPIKRLIWLLYVYELRCQGLFI